MPRNLPGLHPAGFFFINIQLSSEASYSTSVYFIHNRD